MHRFDVGTGADKRFSLRDRVALVTGGSRGLGEAMVWGFARAGANVVIASRKVDRCQELARRVQAETNCEALAYGCHVGRWEEIDGLVDAAYERFGQLDIVVNNAGTSLGYDGLSDVTEKLWDATFAVNVKGPFRLSVRAGLRMAESGSGSIINISSTASLHPRPELAPYAAAKAALNAITQALVHELAPTVRINAIVAGPFATDITASWSPELVKRRAGALALGRLGAPDDIVGAALYLASDASSFTTGTLLTVDGGYPL